VADLHNLASYRGEGRRLSAPVVAQALQALGGAAHRDMIVNLLLGSLHHPPAKPVLAQEVDRVLREHAGDSPLFAQMFGPDSRRWMLKIPLASTKPSALPRSLSKRRLQLIKLDPAAKSL